MKLGGIVLLSREQVEDAGPWSPQSETARVVQDAFSHDLDQGLITGNGTPPNPNGVVGIAASVGGASLLAAASAGLAAIGEAGGIASHLALSPTLFATTAGSVDSTQRPLYLDGLTTLLGLTLVQVPGLTTPLVYDATGVRFVVSRDFRADASTDYAPAYSTDSVALRISGRFNVAVPVPAKSIRKLTIA